MSAGPEHGSGSTTTTYDPPVTAIDFPPDLLALEARAWEEIQAGRLTVATATAVHDGVAAFAETAGVARIDIEMGLKRVVRHGGATEAA